MGTSKKSNYKQQEENMKVLSAIIAAAAATDASWDGVSVENSCGMTISGENFVNKTCTISGSSIQYMFAGNGAFVNGADSFTGFDGTSSMSTSSSSSHRPRMPMETSTTPPAGMPQSHALTPAPTTPDLFSWRTSTTTATPRTATTTSKSPTLTTVTFSPSS